MAPTVCAENEDRLWNNRNNVQNKNNESNSLSSVINYAGKITHKRSIMTRNFKSYAHSLKLQRISSTIKNYPNTNSTRNSETESNRINNDRNSDSTHTYNYYDRLTYSYIKNMNSLSTKNHIIINNNQKNINELSDTNNSISIIPRIYNYERDSKLIKTLPLSIHNLSHNMYYQQPLNSNSKNLLSIAVKTIKLIKRNQLLQRKITQLQLDTKKFVETEITDPENIAIKQEIEYN